MMLKRLSVVAAIAVFSVATTRAAEARGLTKADHALINKTMAYVNQLAMVFEKNANDPDKLIAGLERFIKKNSKKMRALGAKIDKLKDQLDKNAQQELQKKYAKHPAIVRMQKAVMAVMMKQQNNQAFQQKLMKMLMSLQAKAKKKKKKDTSRKQ